jgi:hypothetical protein
MAIELLSKLLTDNFMLRLTLPNKKGEGREFDCSE